MEVALRRRLAGVAEVSISQQDQRATVSFVPGTDAFSATEFRRAVAEADVEVMTMHARVCGLVDDDGRLRMATEDRAPLVLLVGEARPGSSICATGQLDDQSEPYTLDVVSVQPRS